MTIPKTSTPMTPAPEMMLALAHRIKAYYSPNEDEWAIILSALCPAATRDDAATRSDVQTVDAWMPIETAPKTVQEFAQNCTIADDRTGYIEFGGTLEDGRPFVLCLSGAFAAKYDRWFILPHVDQISSLALPSAITYRGMP